jgi:hypothetical protein
MLVETQFSEVIFKLEGGTQDALIPQLMINNGSIYRGVHKCLPIAILSPLTNQIPVLVSMSETPGHLRIAAHGHGLLKHISSCCRGSPDFHKPLLIAKYRSVICGELTNV